MGKKPILKPWQISVAACWPEIFAKSWRTEIQRARANNECDWADACEYILEQLSHRPPNIPEFMPIVTAILALRWDIPVCELEKEMQMIVETGGKANSGPWYSQIGIMRLWIKDAIANGIIDSKTVGEDIYIRTMDLFRYSFSQAWQSDAPKFFGHVVLPRFYICEMLVREDPSLAEKYTTKQLDILRVLYIGQHDSTERRLPYHKIAYQAEGQDASEQEYIEAGAQLVRVGLLRSKRGRGGGVWLTQDGIVAARTLCNDTVRPRE